MKRKWSSSSRTLGGDLYWKYFSGICVLLIDHEGHICKECVCCYSDGDLEMVHLRVTGECGAKELGQSCLLTRPWTLNRNIESEGEKQLEIIIQYPVRPAEIRHICQQRDTQLSDDLMKNWFLRILSRKIGFTMFHFSRLPFKGVWFWIYILKSLCKEAYLHKIHH